MSSRTRSLSRARARSLLALPGRGFMRFLQQFDYSEVAWPPGGFLASDDIRQRRHPEPDAVNVDRVSPVTDPFIRPDSVNRRHEIELEPVVPYHAIQVGGRIVGSEHDRPESTCEGLQLVKIPGRPSKQKVKIDRGDRRALQSGRGVANEHRFESDIGEVSADLHQVRSGIHGVSIVCRPLPFAMSS